MIYRFRIVLDHEGETDIFRDLEIRNTDTLEDLHNSIIQAFGFDGMEMASFYESDDEWTQGKEYSLFNMFDEAKDVSLMQDAVLEDVFHRDQTRMLYVYDFFKYWTFLVELGEIVEETEGVDYPNLMFVQGQIDFEAPERQFETDPSAASSDEDWQNFNPDEFDENWN